MEDDGERMPGPEETLQLIEEQRSAAMRALHGDPLLLYVPWGVAWLIGFTALFLHYGLDGRAYAPISHGQALAVHMTAQVLAGAVFAVGVARLSGRVRGRSSARDAMYGWSWAIGMLLMSVVAGRISPLLSPGDAGLLWAGSALTVVAVLYMAGAALYVAWPMFFMGVWVAVVNGAGVLLGPGWHALLAAVLLGGGLIAAGLVLRRCR